MKLTRNSALLMALMLVSFQIPPHLAEDFLKMLQQKTERYNQEKPVEKIYVQTDKPFYQPGDDLWFSTFVVNGTDHAPSAISGVVYAELISPKGAVEKKLSLPVKNGQAHGDFRIEEEMPGGIYKIRVYTLWMKNFGENEFFEKEIQVQKVITPRLLMKLEFERKAYGAGEEAIADFEVKDLENQVLTQEISYSIQLAGQNFIHKTTRTDTEGKAKISFKLPEKLESNDGLLNITVQYEGKTEAISRAVPIVLNKIELAFFPEGGDLVQNIQSKVAFKALNEFGKPADIQGFISDEAGKSLAEFKSFHDGMGIFEFTPQAGKKYFAHITHPKVGKTYQLPAVLPKGFTLSVENQEKNSVSVNIQSPVEKTLYLVAQIRGKILFSEEISAKIGKNPVSIPLKKMPIGVMQITLFDHNQVPRCERMVFVNSHKKLNISLQTDKKQYSPREKVELTVKTTDEDDLPVPANLAVSVVDDQLVRFADDKQDNILSQLLVSSDVRGKIHEPEFYFRKGETKSAQALDYLLLTQGWRHFTWKEILEENPEVRFVPEKSGSISGFVKNIQTGKPVVATLTLIELGNKNRSAQLLTQPDGSFTFVNTDPHVIIQLFAQADGIKDNRNIRIIVDENLTSSTQIPLANNDKNEDLNSVIEKKAVKANTEVATNQPAIAGEPVQDLDNQDMTLKPDVASLQEVVVVGYATQQKRDVTGAIVTVARNEIDATTIMPRVPMEQILQGRAAGVTVTQANTGATKSKVAIRGTSSLANSQVLYVIDGFPVQDDDISFLQPENIQTITVVKGASATATYGSRATNGAIIVTTKDRNYQSYQPNYNYQNPKKNLANLLIQPRTFSVVREFPTSFQFPSFVNGKTPQDETQNDFRQTILWQPVVQTDKNGVAKLTFYNSDQLTTFRITAEGIASNGLVGRNEETYFTQKAFQLDTKIPPYLSFEDKVELPVFLKNNSEKVLNGKISASAKGLRFEKAEENISLAPQEAKTVYLPAEVLPLAGKSVLVLTFQNETQKEKIELPIDIQPKGFPTEVSYSGKNIQNNIIFNLNEYVKGSLSANLTAYPDVLSDLMGGVEGIFREPYGCFEQTSSSTYPNVLALQYLQETGKVNPEVAKTALGYIQRGYKRLIGYETSQHGFEWFGHTPPHEGLTAFGIMEFLDMKKMYKGVDDEMIERTKKWLMGRRDGKGGFQQNSHGMDGFYGAGSEIINSYIVFALCEAGMGKQIQPEYEKSYQQALQSEDLYEMALMANASLKLGESSRAESLIKFIVKEANEKTFEKCKIKTSVTSSYGKSLQVETASLLVSAMLKTVAPDLENLQKTINYIVSARSYGTFGSTQATVLALKALTDYAKFSKRTAESGTLSVYLNDKLLDSKQYDIGTQGEIRLTHLEKYMQPGKQRFKVAFTETNQALPYSLNINWSGYTPASSKECRVALETKLTSGNTQVGNTLRLKTILKNKTDKGLPMAVAIIGIPSGLSFQPWQLKELQEKRIFDYYEIRNNYVIFYYKTLNPSAVHEINLDLKAEVSGNYQAPASTVYLYYTAEYKDWQAGEKVKIAK